MWSLPLPTTRYLALVRTSAWYDLIATLPFATPWSFVWMYGGLAMAAQALGLPGTVHPLDATHVLLANMLGSVVVVWSMARLLAPNVLFGRLDGVARLMFAAWQIFAYLSGANAIVLGFTAFELLFGVLQWLPVERAPAAVKT